jgi:hypothetical protein
MGRRRRRSVDNKDRIAVASAYHAINDPPHEPARVREDEVAINVKICSAVISVRVRAVVDVRDRNPAPIAEDVMRPRGKKGTRCTTFGRLDNLANQV